MLVYELIEKKAILKYTPKEGLDEYDAGAIFENTEYFQVLNTREIFETTNEMKIFAVMRDNEFQGLSYHSGCCSWSCDFKLFNNGYTVC